MQKARQSTLTHQVYPTAREEYTYRVGSFGEFVITLVLELSDFVVESHEVNANGADIILLKQNVGIEVWNHCKAHNYEEKILAVINNLKPFKYKIVIATFISRKTKARLEAEGITVKVLGYQLLPSDYLQYYTKTRETHGKKFAFEKMVKLLTNQLKPLINTIKNQSTANIIKTRVANVFTISPITRIISLSNKIQNKLERINICILNFTSKRLRIRLKTNNSKQMAYVKYRLHISHSRANLKNLILNRTVIQQMEILINSNKLPKTHNSCRLHYSPYIRVFIF